MNFKIDLPQDDYSQLIIGGMMVWTVLFLIALVRVLTRRDLDAITRLTWVIVLIFVPFFGLALYALVGPPSFVPKPVADHNQLAGTPWEDNPGYTSSAPRNT